MKLCRRCLLVRLGHERARGLVWRAREIRALVLFLVVSIVSVRAIPFMKPWGADLRNVLAYQTCTKGGNPYVIPGGVCGDLWGRPMLYPPLLIRSFFWLRGLTPESAVYCWCSFVVVACLGCLWAWRRMVPAHKRDSADWVPVAFGLLLLFQFPMVFALERGNTDIWSILGWTAAAFFICRNRLRLAGLAAGLAAAYKLYPAIPCAAVVLGMFWASFGAKRCRRTNFLRFGVPAILSFVTAQAMFYRESIWYFARVLPDFARRRIDDPLLSHSILATCGIHDTFSSLVCLALFGTWTWACRRGLRQQPALTMAGLLAIFGVLRRNRQ